jgi:hypothetical protein
MVTVIFLFTACDQIIRPEIPEENENPNINIAEQGVVEVPQVTLAVLPDLSTAQKIQKGMLYADVVKLMGPPISTSGTSFDNEKILEREESGSIEMSYIWTLIDEGGLVEVTFLMSETPVVTEIAISESNYTRVIIPDK